MIELKSVNFEVFGKVQGVFFRKYTQENANKLGLNGFVQNTSRGTVIGVLEGESSAIENMKSWLKNTGSPMSLIENVSFTNEKTIQKSSYNGFNIIRD
ncbi:acylphosphatase-1-like [Cimex lectularius]|uniref:Acylphosphatase n=1 Tax=Cimex lectularius TaxID=79782 RepID=A0A8I6RJF7_CIMLE|nr:acylphosphatase-1-like [Cimex lectularius]